MSNQVLVYDDGEQLYIGKDQHRGNQFTDMIQSPLELISERGQRYQADIQVSYLSEEHQGNPVKLKADPSSIAYYLEPGEQCELRREIPGVLVKEGEELPLEFEFEPRMYSEPVETVLEHVIDDPKIHSLGGESATLLLEDHPIKQKAI